MSSPKGNPKKEYSISEVLQRILVWILSWIFSMDFERSDLKKGNFLHYFQKDFCEDFKI